MPRYRRPDAAVPARVRGSGRNYIIVTVSAGKSKPSGRLFQKYTGGIPSVRAAGPGAGRLRGVARVGTRRDTDPRLEEA